MLRTTSQLNFVKDFLTCEGVYAYHSAAYPGYNVNVKLQNLVHHQQWTGQ